MKVTHSSGWLNLAATQQTIAPIARSRPARSAPLKKLLGDAPGLYGHLNGHKSHRSSGFTVTEMTVAAFVGCIFVGAMAVIFMTSSLSLARMGDYINMDRASRNALDQMTRNIRRAKLLTSFDPSYVVFNYDNAATTNLAYRYNASAAVLTEEWTTAGGTATNTLLTGCSNLVFSLYDHALGPTTDVSSGRGKVVRVAWQSYGPTLLAQKSTENMQQANIVIRNQP